MSYDRIWMCPSLRRKDWVEFFSKSHRLISNDETFSQEAIDKMLKKYGKFSVSLTTGAYDERYLFVQEKDARRFFADGPLAPEECGYRERQRIEEGDVTGSFDKGLGFDRVELYVRGKLVEKK